ncbi:MAG TPA: c-type cytochrome [Chlorobaculum parvum]|uniref:C-type cytochrome n=1 Tax=Chlorobaculum parvum TaxID=274539 RepID=A0A7C5DJQ1_9CHLB|nr:c-type cytochrome [Chlorobaculum parvum]
MSKSRKSNGWLVISFAILFLTIAYMIVNPPTNQELLPRKIDPKVMKTIEQSTETEPASGAERYIGNPDAIAAGKAEYDAHCAACHLSDARGAIGPNLRKRLKFGSTPEKIYESIALGRPAGMPAFGKKLNDEKISKIIAFIESLR